MKYFTDHPLIGVYRGNETDAILLSINSANLSTDGIVFAPIAKTSETTMGALAAQKVDARTGFKYLTLEAVAGAPNLPVRQEDRIELSFGTSAEPPYTLKVFSAETDALLAEYQLVNK